MQRNFLQTWCPGATAVLLAAATCLVPRAVLAEEKAPAEDKDKYHPEIEIGVVGGGHFFSDTNALGKTDMIPEGSGLRHSGAVGARLGIGISPHFMPEVEFLIIPTVTTNEVARVQVLAWRAHMLFSVLTGRFRPFLLLGGGALSSFSSHQNLVSDDTDSTFHTGLGFKVDFTKHIGLRLDGRVLLPPDVKRIMAPDYEALLGFYARFGIGKPASDQPADTDGDGVSDREDKCPAQAGLKENGGCPDKDTDNDGFVDRLDKCPTEPGIKENEGCPDRDADSDGVVDRLDKCPTEAGVKENEGCPDRDTDNDGVVDRLDKCLNVAETKNNYEDEDGCPDEIPQQVQKFTGAIQGIRFAPWKAVIMKDSFKVLDQAVGVLKEYPAVRLEISGHTDTSGDPAKNRILSQERADAVRKYLVDKGIAEDRLVAVGYGPDRPIADNKTAAGRAKNRRVEFQLITAAQAPAAPANGTPPSGTAPAQPAPASNAAPQDAPAPPGGTEPRKE